jgi:hypothetical protein
VEDHYEYKKTEREDKYPEEKRHEYKKVEREDKYPEQEQKEYKNSYDDEKHTKEKHEDYKEPEYEEKKPKEYGHVEDDGKVKQIRVPKLAPLRCPVCSKLTLNNPFHE